MVSGIRCVGVVRGYLTTVLWSGKKNISLGLNVTQEERKSLAKPVKAALKGLGKPSWSDGCLSVVISTPALGDVYAEGVVKVIDILRSFGLRPAESCHVCGRSGCDAAVPVGAAYAPVHRSCLENETAAAREKAAENAQNGSYMLGFLGGLLGMLVGIIPSTVTILALNRIFVWLFALIPLFTYAGYRLLKGKMNHMALAVSILLTVVGVFAIFYIQIFYYTISDLGYGFGELLEAIPEVLGDKYFFELIVKNEDFAMCAVFAALGIFLAWGQISRTSKNDIADAQRVAGSAIPLSVGEPVAPQDAPGKNHL